LRLLSLRRAGGAARINMDAGIDAGKGRAIRLSHTLNGKNQSA
jgi:hypothetical protein